jgi:molybdopterin/thiamine biosynthesis adenylyltransferase
MFGEIGQELLAQSKVGIIGGGGAGSIENELAAHLGAGEIVIIDPDRLEPSNRSRVVGSRAEDCYQVPGELKVNIAQRVARQANQDVRYAAIPDSVAFDDVAMKVRDCDFLLLAADSMQARLVFNALVHQYLIPGIQVGAKVVPAEDGALRSAFSVVRWVTPDTGCLLCNGLIDPKQLALEAKDKAARKEQDYGSGQPNPSVVTMNAVAAAHAVNDFMGAFLSLVRPDAETAYRRYDHLSHKVYLDEPRQDEACTECGHGDGSRLGMGDRVRLPTLLRAKEPA